MPGPRSLSRRDLLRLGGVSLAGGLAGCESIVGGGQRTTSTTTATTETGTPASTTTTRPARDALTPKPANVGPYTDWMVAKEGASLFLFEYYPRYSWLVNHLPEREDWGRQVVRSEINSTGLLDPVSVTEYFYGFTDVNELKYHILWGDFDVDSIISTVTEDPEDENNPGLRGFTATYNDIGEFDTYYRDEMVFGLTPEMMIVVDGTYEDAGYYASMQNFRRLRDSIHGNGDSGASFADANEDYALLTEHLQRGHQIICRPSTAEELDLGTTAYGRQFSFVNQDYSMVDDVLVWDEPPSRAEVRETVTGSKRLYEYLPIGGAGIEEIAIDGRTAVVKYPPIPNKYIYIEPGYSG